MEFTPEQIKQMMEQEPEEPPYRFTFRQDRYYVAMWFFNLPDRLSEFGKGGDVTWLLWRKNEEPTKWYLLFRFRHYKGKDAWDGKDKKTWHFKQGKWNSQEEAETALVKSLQFLTRLADQKLECLRFDGNGEKAMNIVLNNPPEWLQVKTQTIPFAE